ncbi:MAG: serine--tRNA ligase [Balneolaceae bacterium]|nr:serine--tRNA ligase [Balneolaceae bacterium]
MLDINLIREQPDLVREGMKKKGEGPLDLVDQVLEADRNWRDLVQRVDELRNESNVKSKKIGELMGSGEKEKAQEIIAETSRLKEAIKEGEEELKELKSARDGMLLRIPNVPHESVPVGDSEEDNKVFKSWGEPAREEWRRPHWEMAEEEGWIDFERGAKVTGAGFPFYVGPLARLQRALVNYFVNKAVEEGYRELQAPYVVNEDSARGTGQIPDKEDMMYEVPRDELYLIPTAEVPVTNFHRDEIVDEEDLPLRYVAYTPCWRREAGSYGKDVRGLNRLHQFDKVELVKMVHPDAAFDELESLREYAESLLEDLGLSYRTLLMCTGDMGFTQSKKYDLEVWSPGQQRWLEVSSCSNFGGFQARRMQLRYRRTGDGEIRILHTLNGSGLALPRVVAALLEAGQQEDGSVKLPDALIPYYGKATL